MMDVLVRQTTGRPLPAAPPLRRPSERRTLGSGRWAAPASGRLRSRATTARARRRGHVCTGTVLLYGWGGVVLVLKWPTCRTEL